MAGYLLGVVIGLVIGVPGMRWLAVRWAHFRYDETDPCEGCPLLALCSRIVPYQPDGR
ncbi:hypothetical protein GCM10010174_26340 [Kutzneria viridogrisea]|uniref:Uncharacterized protein n=1 Tax=Kutzneria viridogrisea TaxID=47990 RepID=A0ABR6BRZ2_9PSEU|nr:hypothetical protein [Kutzneria viridogrisea]